MGPSLSGAWGGAWGAAWGNSWGQISTPIGGGADQRRRKKQPSAEDQIDEARLEFLRQDDESLLFALVAIVASRRLH